MYSDIKTFDKNVKNIKLNSLVEKNNFSLVRNFLNGEIKFSQSGIMSSDYITDDFIFNNDIDIFMKIGTLKPKFGSKKDKEVISLLEEKESKLKNLFDTYKKYCKNGYYDTEYLSTLRKQMFYLILELRVSLNMNLDAIVYSEISNYCEIIANDVVNNKYKRLNFQSHLDYNGKLDKR